MEMSPSRKKPTNKYSKGRGASSNIVILAIYLVYLHFVFLYIEMHGKRLERGPLLIIKGQPMYNKMRKPRLLVRRIK